MTIAAGGLLALIRARYPGPEWAVLDELHDGTGGSATRRFDAVAFNCWPSRGFVRLGFEIKVTRGDFARELGDHAKRAALERSGSSCKRRRWGGTRGIQVRAQGAAGVENDLRSLHNRLGALLEVMPRREVCPLDVPE